MHRGWLCVDDQQIVMPFILVIGEAALAAGLVSLLIFKHLRQNLPIGSTSTCIAASLQQLAKPWCVPAL